MPSTAPGPEGTGLERVPDLDSLHLLLRVAATGSLGRAGAAHGISQPATSARIRTMERLVGFPLVERGARGSTLTPAGALLADWARDVLTAADVLAAGITSLRADTEARLRVAASLTVAEHLLPRWLVRLATDRPETAVSLTAVNSTAVERAVLAATADLGFVEGPTLSPGLDAQVVARDRLVAVVAPTHPWARRRSPVTAAELAATRLVCREPTSGTRTALDAALAAHGTRAAPLLELSTATAVRAAVAAGAGPAVLSHLAVHDDLTSGRLAEVPVTGATLTRRLRAVWPHGQRPGGPARDLLRIATRRDRAAPQDRGPLA
ncbi:LysR family transcriptional regulator [Kineococcus glutinatus]